MYEPGCEYLVANPIDIPSFGTLLRSICRGSNNSTWRIPDGQGSFVAADSFMKLPWGLRNRRGMGKDVNEIISRIEKGAPKSHLIHPDIVDPVGWH